MMRTHAHKPWNWTQKWNYRGQIVILPNGYYTPNNLTLIAIIDGYFANVFDSTMVAKNLISQLMEEWGSMLSALISIKILYHLNLCTVVDEAIHLYKLKIKNLINKKL